MVYQDVAQNESHSEPSGARAAKSRRSHQNWSEKIIGHTLVPFWQTKLRGSQNAFPWRPCLKKPATLRSHGSLLGPSWGYDLHILLQESRDENLLRIANILLILGRIGLCLDHDL